MTEKLRKIAIDYHQYGKAAFLIVAASIVAVLLYMFNSLIDDLSKQERERMEIWADATKEIINIGSSVSDSGPTVTTDIDFLLSIIERNTTIPVLLTDDDGNILQFRNFALPEMDDASGMMNLTPANEKYLKKKLATLSHSPNVIDIDCGRGLIQHLYYEDSTLLKRLSYYPYIQLAIMLVFIAIVYFAVLSIKKAEQNKVWVGLSKETAHQLGTPISSLMAWMELLPEMGVDADTVGEMNKDVQRLSMIASRFSKIGSVPQMEDADANAIVKKATDYMATRVSPRVAFATHLCAEQLPVKACPPLFVWVMENLIKNAVDAMEGHGALTVTTMSEHGCAAIEVKDSGKGIPRKNFKTVFNPGYTTKKRGWGLGLTLAKRIIEEYHLGRIFVKASAPGFGTTFRIEIPLQADGEQQH